MHKAIRKKISSLGVGHKLARLCSVGSDCRVSKDDLAQPVFTKTSVGQTVKAENMVTAFLFTAF